MSSKKEIEDHDYDVIVMSNKRSKRDIKHVLGHVTHKVAKRKHTGNDHKITQVKTKKAG